MAALVFVFASTAIAAAKPGTLDRIHERGRVSCGSAIRPGLAFPSDDGTFFGLNVELCHAIAAAVLGDPGKIEFHGYALKKEFARIRSGDDDVAFLTATEMFANELIDTVLPGPTVFQVATQVLVWDTNPVRHVADLGRTMVCDEPGTAAEHNLQSYAGAHRWAANISGWMELEEMMDAFAVGRCPAIVGEATALGAIRISTAHDGHPSRLLPEPLGITPMVSASAADDPRWSMVVSWTMATVLGNQGGAGRLDIPGAWLGLDKGWQARVRAVGPYSELFRHTLGDESALDLLPYSNRPWNEGGMIVAPTID